MRYKKYEDYDHYKASLLLNIDGTRYGYSVAIARLISLYVSNARSMLRTQYKHPIIELYGRVLKNNEKDTII